MVKKAKKDLNAYSFFFGTDKSQRTKNIVKHTNFKMSADEEQNSEAAENMPYFKNLMTSPSMKSKFLMLHWLLVLYWSCNATLRLQSEKPKRAKYSTVEEKHLSMLNRIDKELKGKSETKETEDEEYFYGQTVAASIQKLGDMEKGMIKQEINNILFKYQMNMYKAQNNPSTSQRITYSSLPIPTSFSAVTSNDFNWQHTHTSNFSQASLHDYGSLTQSTNKFNEY